jgi:dienelactone hydrolase
MYRVETVEVKAPRGDVSPMEAQHGFYVARYGEEQSEDAWEAVLAFFNGALGPAS